jgi:hypothetical protein
LIAVDILWHCFATLFVVENENEIDDEHDSSSEEDGMFESHLLSLCRNTPISMNISYRCGCWRRKEKKEQYFYCYFQENCTVSTRFRHSPERSTRFDCDSNCTRRYTEKSAIFKVTRHQKFW